MEEEVFEIENIANNEGCFVTLLKYATLFIIGFIAIWIMILKTFSAIGFEHGKLFSFIISMGLTGYFLHKILNRSDEVYKIIFNDKDNTVTLVSGNTFDGVDASVKIQYDALLVLIEENPIIKSRIKSDNKTQLRDDKLSQNRKVEIFDSNRLVRIINVDLSNWCRHKEIDYILGKLLKSSNKK
jgi:hypothetical protein